MLRALRAQMGVMLGGTTLFDASVFGSLTVYENIASPLRLCDDDAVHTCTTQWLHALLDGFADRMPEELLPAHTRRRIALGRALVPDRPLVVLDDVDLCMDATTAARTVQGIRNAQQRTGATMLMTTHDIKWPGLWETGSRFSPTGGSWPAVRRRSYWTVWSTPRTSTTVSASRTAWAHRRSGSSAAGAGTGRSPSIRGWPRMR
ncbi:hypothetical protein [Pseudonocardia acidicola]|uniref:ABC transporter family protein n=1 Tax=Pseudonocardia acidicola TaxID=2724939 RepID=A0ABX1SG60_9PSEU|nr:hypothetical protein [Pseudonocardia acidicola]NMI00541.1 hypothetical protein [Pseudonocardia acidicola]